MCAMIPMSRVLAICSTPTPATASGTLPAIVGERLVGFGHLVAVFALLHRGAAVLRGVEHLVGEPLHHRLLGARPRSTDEPAVRQRLADRQSVVEGKRSSRRGR